MYIIEKLFSFSSSHQLKGLPSSHRCSRLHGHNYSAIFTFKKPTLNDVGFVVDYRELDVIKQWIDAQVDHRHLNEIFEFNPTAELIAKHFYEVWSKTFEDLSSVTIMETPKTAATYEPFLITDRKRLHTR